MSDFSRVVDSIADINGLAAALAAKQATSEKNQPNGYPGLDNLGDILARVIPRNGTAAALAALVPDLGESVFETDTKRVKVGDGVSTVATLTAVGLGVLPTANASPAFSADSALYRFASLAALETGGALVTLVDLDLLPFKRAGLDNCALAIDLDVLVMDDIQRTRRQTRRATASFQDGSPQTFVIDGAVQTPYTDFGSLGGVVLQLNVGIASNTHLKVTVTADDDSEPIRWAADLKLHVLCQ